MLLATAALDYAKTAIPALSKGQSGALARTMRDLDQISSGVLALDLDSDREATWNVDAVVASIAQAKSDLATFLLARVPAPSTSSEIGLRPHAVRNLPPRVAAVILDRFDAPRSVVLAFLQLHWDPSRRSDGSISRLLKSRAAERVARAFMSAPLAPRERSPRTRLEEARVHEDWREQYSRDLRLLGLRWVPRERLSAMTPDPAALDRLLDRATAEELLEIATGRDAGGPKEPGPAIDGENGDFATRAAGPFERHISLLAREFLGTNAPPNETRREARSSLGAARSELRSLEKQLGADVALAHLVVLLSDSPPGRDSRAS